jgi:hypothetical protein
LLQDQGIRQRAWRDCIRAENRRICRKFTRLFGFRLAKPILSGGIARSPDIGLATFRVVRLAIPETELIPSGRPLL